MTSTLEPLVYDSFCQLMTRFSATWSMDTSGEEHWQVALRDHAARLAFPEWLCGPDDWTSLAALFTDDGAPYTEVAVYRNHNRIHYHVYRGDELTAFWNRLLGEISE
ncbi:hypothetical protein ACFWYW_04045 [Nonomuraea sp. NPDC059023]|uniref:hypothetical protein n=1 Tax=unclassified Nonomuraea TaxID=2593643 RepID=UPI003694428E